jgi:glyoxylase I family protein
LGRWWPSETESLHDQDERSSRIAVTGFGSGSGACVRLTLEHAQPPAFASVSLDDVQILRRGPGASGARAMRHGRRQEPGGWNRIVLKVTDLPSCIAALKNAGVHLRNEMQTGPGGRQVQVDDPDGNPIELFEPAR